MSRCLSVEYADQNIFELGDLASVYQGTVYSQCGVCSNRARRFCLNFLSDLILSTECGWTSLKCSKAAPICAITRCTFERANPKALQTAFTGRLRQQG